MEARERIGVLLTTALTMIPPRTVSSTAKEMTRISAVCPDSERVRRSPSFLKVEVEVVVDMWLPDQATVEIGG